jgi:hypothetical protein
VYLKDFLPGYTGGVVGNGYHRYAPDLTGEGLAAGAEVYDNLATGASPALRLKTGGKPGVLVIRLASPYVYLGGRLTLKAVRKSDADKVAVSISTNNGRTFMPLWTADHTGSRDAVIDLSEKIYRRYAYWLKLEFASVTPDGAGLDAFAVENDIQHAPRTLPWLGQGANTITVAADHDPAIAWQPITCRITPDPRFAKNESTGSMGVVFENLEVQDGSCWWRSGVGAMTVPIRTPGELTALSFSTQYRARGPKDVIRVLLSFDEGQTWSEAAKLTGPTPGKTEYHRVPRLPEGHTKALLRYELTGNNTVGILSFRIDADHKDPRAAAAFRPFDVVYRWKENGQEQVKTRRIHHLPQTYTINTASDPEMVAVSCEMPAK